MSEALLIAKLNLIASKIAHEDNLIGQRTTWLVMSQSFLFGAFAALVVEMNRAGTPGPMAKILRIVIPLVGVLLPFLVLSAVCAATFALSRWRAERARILTMPEARDLDWPEVDHRAVRVAGQLLPLATALGFMLAWLAILVRIRAG